uniref:RNase H type-1 domain-containing protein n=1 Tax=Aegilops tauschii TaxID=37682 RepID=M8D6Y8_AEGTA
MADTTARSLTYAPYVVEREDCFHAFSRGTSTSDIAKGKMPMHVAGAPHVKKHAPRSATRKDELTWSPPPEGWTKLNTDGAYQAADRSAGAGMFCYGLCPALEGETAASHLKGDDFSSETSFFVGQQPMSRSINCSCPRN